MKKLQSTLPNMMMSLGIITVAAGAILGAVYQITKEPIAAQAAEAQVSAIREVAPPFDNDPEADKWQTEIGGQQFTVYPALENGELRGAAVRGVSMNGFAGEIVVMAGFCKDGTINDYRVLSQAETPGLGTKMEEWFRNPAGARSVLGRNPASESLYVSKDEGGTVDAITAATISSRAFLEAMRDAYEAYRRYAADHGTDLGGAGASEGDASTGASRQNRTGNGETSSGTSTATGSTPA